MDLEWAPDVDGAGPCLDFLGMAPVYPVEGRMMGLAFGTALMAIVAAATFSSLSLLIITFLL